MLSVNGPLKVFTSATKVCVVGATSVTRASISLYNEYPVNNHSQKKGNSYPSPVSNVKDVRACPLGSLVSITSVVRFLSFTINNQSTQQKETAELTHPLIVSKDIDCEA